MREPPRDSIRKARSYKALYVSHIYLCVIEIRGVKGRDIDSEFKEISIIIVMPNTHIDIVTIYNFILGRKLKNQTRFYYKGLI